MPSTAPAARARSTTGPIGDERVDVRLRGWCGRARTAGGRACSSSRPMASSTWEGWGTPAEHAEPVEQAMPRASSSISSESPSQPGNVRWALPGSRWSGEPSGSPLTRRRGPARRPGHQVVAQAADPLGVLGLLLDRDLHGRGEAGDCGGVDGARSDVTLLARRRAAARHRAARDVRRGRRRRRAADLVPGEGEQVDAARGEVDRHLADGLHRVGVDRDAVRVRDATRPRDRLDGADLVVGPHHRHQGDRAGVALDGGAQRVDLEPAEVVDRQQLDLGALVLGEPVQRVEHGVVLDRGGKDAGPTRASASRRDQKRPLTARLSASVPPEVNTMSPGRAFSAVAMRLATSSTTRRADAPGACSEMALPTGRAGASSLTRRAGSGSSRRGRGRRSVCPPWPTSCPISWVGRGRPGGDFR